MNVWKNTKVRTPFGTTANFNRIRMGQPIYFDGNDYFMLDINKPNSSPEAVIHLPKFNEDWDNEELIRDFLDDVEDMLDHYKSSRARADISEDGQPTDYDELVKTLFIDRVIEIGEEIGIRFEAYDDPINVDESLPVTTAGEMARRLSQWPRDTVVFINNDENQPDAYTWHFPIVYTPSSDEKQKFFKHGESSFTAIDLDPDVQGQG